MLYKRNNSTHYSILSSEYLGGLSFHMVYSYKTHVLSLLYHGIEKTLQMLLYIFILNFNNNLSDI